MEPQQVATRYIERFAAGNLDGLRRLLKDDLRFRGPLLQCSGADAYLSALSESSSAPAEAIIRHVIQDGDDVSVFYDLVKPDTTTTVAQHFHIVDGRIADTLVVFDTHTFR